MIIRRASWWPPRLPLLVVVAALLVAGCAPDGSVEAGAGPAPAASTSAATAATPTDGADTAPPATARLTRISAEEAVVVRAEEDVTVLDVRTPAEYAQGHLPGALNVDLAGPDFAGQVQTLPRDTTYLVYCRSGNRSREATDTMASLGFTSLYDVQGGIRDWLAAGGDVAR